METPLHRGAFPGARRLARGVNKRRETRYVGKDVKDAIVMAEAWRPDAPSVNVFAILEAEFSTEIEAITGIGEQRPIDKVLRMENGKPRAGVHRGSGEVVITPNPDHVRV